MRRVDVMPRGATEFVVLVEIGREALTKLIGQNPEAFQKGVCYPRTLEERMG